MTGVADSDGAGRKRSLRPDREHAEMYDTTPTSHATAESGKRRPWGWIVGTLAALVIGFALGQAAAADNDESEAAAQTTTSPEPTPTDTMTAPRETREPEPERTYYAPTVEDFRLEVKTLGKECFGSAGCNIDFRVELGYSGLPMDPTATYEVTYEITGGEDPYINTLTVEGSGEYSTDREEFIGTASSDDQLAAEIIDVSEY